MPGRQTDWDDVSLGDEWGKDLDTFEMSNGSYPQSNLSDSGTFKIRTDPKPLLDDYRLQLMNAYKKEEKVKQKDGSIKTITKVKFKKNTVPRANKQGVEDIISYVQKFINNHSVQGNLKDRVDLNNFMKDVSINLTAHFHTKRLDWGISINDIDMIISNAVHLIELFLTRTIENQERILYGETFKENREFKSGNNQKPNIWQRLGGFLGGSRTKRGDY